MDILNAQAIVGLTPMPERYRVLVDRHGKIVQRGVLDLTFRQLYEDLKNLDRPDWMKDGIVQYWFDVRHSDSV